jgi:hypothetical protein
LLVNQVIHFLPIIIYYRLGDHKFLYVSFDSGKTFEEKYVAPVDTLVNIIHGMYAVYRRFAPYYKMLDEKDGYHVHVDDSSRALETYR